MWRLLCRCLAVLYAATRLPTVNAHLWNIEYTASNNIFVNVAQKILAEDEAVTISKPCTVTPEDFDVRTSRDRFFVVSCLSTVPKVQVFLRGDFVFNKEGAPVPSDGYVIPLTHASEPTLLSAYSCDNAIYGDVTNLKNCIPFSVSVYRRSGQLAHLSAIGVTSNRLAALRPNFNAFHFYYNASVEINQPLAISASVMENMAKVGIEFEGSPGVDSGLTQGMTCGHGTQSNEVWKLPGFKAVGEYRYKLCAFAPFSHHVREYHIKVVVTPLYSSKLTTIDVGRFTLVPPFEEHVQSYHVTIPGNVMTVPVSAVSKDKQASIFIAYDGHEERAGHDEEDEGEVLRGSASASVAMHDNSELKVGEPPQWTMPVTFRVRSADGSHTMSYVVTISQTVDTFCHLQNLTVGTSACELVPAFSPNVTEYYCEWWWEDAHGKEVTWGEVVPYMDKARCKDCWLLAPSDKTEPGHFLNIHWESVQRDKWPWGKAWRREFKYGDHHIIPFQVVSADKFTHTTYHVHLFRNAPWWMQTWLTRFVSHAASTLSIIMAISSAANVMALAKQVQFMTLTTEIDGVPKVYEDFANGLRTFNLDAFGWIPWERFGLPTADQIKDYKKNMKKYVEHELGIDHATLLLQYCEALANNYQNGDMVYPNAILDLIPENSATLLKQLKKRKAREEAEAKKKAAAAAAAADAGAATGAKVTDSSDTKDSDSTDAEAASERRLLDRGMAAIISWVSQWIYTPSSSDDDMSVHDAKVSLRGAGFSVVSSSSVLLERPLPQNYSRNSSFAILDKSFLSGVVPSMHALSTDIQVRRLQMEDLVGDDEEEEEEELSDEEKFAKKLDWTDDDYDAILKLVLNKSKETNETLRGKYKQIKILATEACESKEVEVIEDTVKFYQEALLFRDMLESTTGVFVILCVGFIVSGSLYYLFYKSFMKGNQKRPRVLEPGPLVIFTCDYCLIAFAKSASKVLFRPESVSVFSYHPSPMFLRILCGTGLVVYPVFFIFFIWFRILDLAHRKRLVWNEKLESFTDPRCQCIKVTVPPTKIPPFIPGVYQVCINHIRACIPVLDQEGDRLDFAASRSQAAVKMEEKSQQGDADAFAKQIDEEIESEIAKIQESETGRSSMVYHRQKLLKSEKQRIVGEAQRKEKHRTILRKQLSDLFSAASHARTSSIEFNENISPPWFEIVGGNEEDSHYKIHNMGDCVKEFASKKKRHDLERVEEEEKLAMMQWIHQQIRKEQKLLKYNIMKIAPEDGYLKPFEPVWNAEKNIYDWAWLPNVSDYNADDSKHEDYDERGHHKLLNEFMEGEKVRWIEDDLGQRLVYKGNDRWWWLGGIAPGGYKGGKLDWWPEPDEGWDEWEKAQNAKSNGMMFADKWQWLYFNEDQPWNADEEDEGEINMGFFKIKKVDITFYPEVKSRLLKFFAKRVPYRVLESEKLEMRKWLWMELMELMECKLKIGYMADLHEKYFLFGSYDKIASMDFYKLFMAIENAAPTEDKLLEHEKAAAKFLEQRFELLDFTLMKVEDTFSYNELEPWMTEVDPTGDSEYKVMFDADMFWKTSSDPELQDIRNENDLIPKTGYFSSAEFLNYPDHEFGVKRYNLSKPDGSLSKVKVKVLMRHVLPLMRYTSGFKLNVPIESLDMPQRDEYKIVLGGVKNGEELNYVIERFTTLVSIILLAGDPGGQLCAVVFFVLKTSGWLYNLRVAYTALKYDEKVEERKFMEAQRELLQDFTMGEETDLTPGEVKQFKKKSRLYHIACACVSAEVSRLFMQALTLFFLVCGQYGMPPPLCAINCILVCCITMIMMNARTAAGELKALMGQAKETLNGVLVQYRTKKNQIQNWLEGDNIFGHQFMVFELRQSALLKADNINLIVPDLGINFEGEVDIPEDAPQEEARTMEMGKKMVHYSMERDEEENDNDNRYKSAFDHPRYEGDLSSGLFVALNVEQLMLRKQLPEIVATIHCVNHATSTLSRPQYDSYLTLTKELPRGEQWEPQFDHDREKVNALLESWGAKFEDWLDRKLGAVETDKTATIKIKDHLKNLLANECTGNTLRDMYFMKIENIELPAKGLCTIDLQDKLGYVQVVYDYEVIPKTSDPARRSKFGRFVVNKEVNGKGPRVTLDLSSEAGAEFSFVIPVGVSRLKFAIWAQDEATATEHLVAFSLFQEVNHLVPNDDEWPTEPAELMLFVKWTLRGPRLLPIGAPETKKGKTPDKGWFGRLKETLWKYISCAWCHHEPTEEELERIRGHMVVSGRAFNDKEHNEDTERMLALEDLSGTGGQGDSSLNQAKLERHKDRWLTIAEVFGIAPSTYDLEDLGEHGRQMEKIGDRMHLIESKLTQNVQSIRTELTRMLSSVTPSEKLGLGWLDALTPAEKSDLNVDDAEDHEARRQSAQMQNMEPQLVELEKKRQILERRQAAEEDSARKERREILLGEGFRRQLETSGEMRKAISRLKKEIRKIRDLLEEDDSKNIHPLHESRIRRRVVGKNVTQSLPPVAEKRGNESDADYMRRWFASKLLSTMEEYKTNQVSSSKQILHYIIMSDQLKPSKSWRPDAISPHVCSIVTREFEDVPEVALIDYFTPGTKVVLQREGGTGSAATLVNGKLCYKAKDKGWSGPNGRIRFDKEGKTADDPMQAVYLYWDGHSRWVFSTKRGESVPYGSRQGDVSGFMWAQDAAVTPDKITAPWYYYDQKWVQDDIMKVLGPNTSSQDNTKSRKSLMQMRLAEEALAAEGGESWFDLAGLCSEVVALFSRAGTRKMDPELKECLVSLQANSLEFAWKDDQIERLATFRRFLLTEFGSYHQAWMYMSRYVSFPKHTGVSNLATLFKESADAFERASNKGEVDNSMARAAFQRSKTREGEDGSPKPKLARSGTFRSGATKSRVSFTQDLSTPEDGELTAEVTTGTIGSGGSGSDGGSSPSRRQRKQNKKRTLTRSKEHHATHHSHIKGMVSKASSSKKTLTETSQSFALSEETEATDGDLEAEDLDYLTEWLQRNKTVDEKGNPSWGALATTIMDELDKDGSNAVSVSELHDLYEDGDDAPTEGILVEFREWCLKHPWYNDFAPLWAELSFSVEVTLDEFKQGMRHVLLKFLSKKKKVGQFVGVSLHDEENVCTVKSAQWENRLDSKDLLNKSKQIRIMVMSCSVQGTTKAIPLCIKKETWSLRAEGESQEYFPDDLPSMEPDLDNVVNVSVRYAGVPEGRKLYFQFGKVSHAPAVSRRAVFTEVSFYPSNPGAPDEKAEQIFADLDYQMSGGISFKELVPISGDRMEDADQSLLKFHIPLSYIQEIRPEAYKTYGVEKKKSIQIKVNAQFASSDEWSALKRALDPDWKVGNAQNETVHFAMRSAYFDLWKQVIDECQMGKPQEWVRFYDGGYMEHQYIKGIFMRAGYGIQRWPDGTVYAGSWENHTYHGAGTLYATVADWQKVVKGIPPGEAGPAPLYQGNWHDGVRNGRGTMNWEQESMATAGDKNPFKTTKSAGVRKCYHGNFKHGLFHGAGILVMRDAVTQTVPHLMQNVGGSRLRKVMFPNVGPTHMMRFEGEFDSSWEEVDNTVRDMDPTFDKNYSGETEPFLKLQDLKKEDQRRKTVRYLRYFGVDRAEVQKSGAPMPDVGLAYYRMMLDGSEALRPHQEPGIPAEATHIFEGKATYSDGSEYEGAFENGWPEGHGVLTVFDFDEGAPAGTPGRWIARYDGEWISGEREGTGNYKVRDQLEYEGQWKDNRKNGTGRQTIDDDCWEDFGYKVYEGDWKDDVRTGVGTAEFPDVMQEGMGKFIFEGQFVENNRHGHGIMKYQEGEGVDAVQFTLYSGAWRNDKVFSPVEEPSWSHMISPDKKIKRYYFGGLNAVGERTGHGILYEEEAMDDEEFQRAFHAGPGEDKAYRPTDPNKHKLYEGQWRKNLPHGNGKQYFDEIKGVYDGQFVNGKRQGRGSWTGRMDKDKPATWTYRPLRPSDSGEEPPNWDDDKMHGIGIVEDAKHVHENVVYTRGVCQMPFTMEGPPLTGFDDTRVIGTVVKSVKKRLYAKHTYKDTEYTGTHLLSMANKRAQQDNFDDRVDLAMGAGVLVRQPTDLNTPEEDVFVDGGTGVNEVMNGLYFKMGGTFGLPIYKLVKRASRFAVVTERYLYQNTDRSMWIIGERYGAPVTAKSVACAAIDSSATHPSQISGKWFVWHDDTRRIRMPGDPSDPLEKTRGWGRKMTPIDVLKVQSIVGFEMTGVTPDFSSHFSSTLMLRNPREFYDRPVYEAENGGHYLYWLSGSYDERSNDDEDTKEASEQRLADGMSDHHGIEHTAEVGDASEIFNQNGAWVLAQEVGSLPGSAKCAAFIVDSGVTPHQIHDKNKWIVRDFSAKNGDSAKVKFRGNAAFRLKLEEWSRNPAKSLGLLDGDEEIEPLLALTDGSPRR